MIEFGDPVSDVGINVNAVPGGALVIGVIPSILAIVAFVIHIVFARAVYRDATTRRDSGRQLWFVSPLMWGGATLLGSALAAAVYWLMHYSTLATTQTLVIEEEASASP